MRSEIAATTRRRRTPGVERHGRLDAAGEAGELRVGDEARPRVDDLVAAVDVGEGELFEQPDRSRSDGDPVALDADVGGEALARAASAVWSG